MAKTTVTVEGLKELEAKLRQLGITANQALRPGVEAGGERWLNDSRRKAPGPNVQMEIGEPRAGRVEASIGPDKKHWFYIFFERGAKAHGIKAKVKKAMRFKLGDEMVFFKRAQHPGIPAAPFLVPPMREDRQGIVNAVGEVWRKTMEKLG